MFGHLLHTKTITNKAMTATNTDDIANVIIVSDEDSIEVLITGTLTCILQGCPTPTMFLAWQ